MGSLHKEGKIRLVQQVDDDGNPAGSGGASYDDWVSSGKTVAAPGTAEQCPNLPAPEGVGVVFKAKDSNTGLVWLGRTKAAAEAHATAFELAAGQSLILFINDVNMVWIDAAVAAEGVSIALEQS